MRLTTPDQFAAAIANIEQALNLQYPTTAATFLSQLSDLLQTSRADSFLRDADFLVLPDEVAAVCDETGSPLIDGYLLPFLCEGDSESGLIYGYEMADPALKRVAVYSVHMIVRDWPSESAFLDELRGMISSAKPEDAA